MINPKFDNTMFESYECRVSVRSRTHKDVCGFYVCRDDVLIWLSPLTPSGKRNISHLKSHFYIMFTVWMLQFWKMGTGMVVAGGPFLSEKMKSSSFRLTDSLGAPRVK